MSHLKPELVLNSTFHEWTGANPDSWQQTSVTATTLIRLQRIHPLNHPEVVATFGTIRNEKYVYDGDSSLRARLTAAAVAGDFIIRQPAAAGAGILVDPLQRYAVTVAARSSVDGNELRVRIIGLVDTTDTFFLEPVGNTAAVAVNYNQQAGSFTWNTTGRDIDIALSRFWRVFGFQFIIPATCTSIAVRVGNGSDGAQDIDIGKVSVLGQLGQGLVGVA